MTSQGCFYEDLPLRRVRIAGDVLRPKRDRFSPAQDVNIAWFARLIRRSVSRTTGLPVDVVQWGQEFDTALFYDLAECPPDHDGWARLYNTPSLTTAAVDYIAAQFHGSLVLGYEMPPVLRGALSAIGVPWIDHAIHPIRFMPDLLIAASSNIAQVYEALSPFHVSAASISLHADLLCASAVRLGGVNPDGLPVLLVGQTNHDRVLIRNGHLHNFSDFGGELRSITRSSPFLLKLHPYGAGDFGFSGCGLPFSIARTTSANIYRLLSDEQIDQVVGLSSSVLVEAPYFGKRVVNLLPLPFHLALDAGRAQPGQHLSLAANILSEAYWAATLSPLGIARPTAERPEPLPPNTLRMSLRSFWGYNELTTDSLLQAAPAGER